MWLNILCDTHFVIIQNQIPRSLETESKRVSTSSSRLWLISVASDLIACVNSGLLQVYQPYSETFAYVMCIRVRLYRSSFRFISQRNSERTARRAVLHFQSHVRDSAYRTGCPSIVLSPRYSGLGSVVQSRGGPRCTRMHRRRIRRPARRDDVSGSVDFFSHRRRRSSQVRRTVRSRSADRTWVERTSSLPRFKTCCAYTRVLKCVCDLVDHVNHRRAQKSEGK